MSSMYRPLTTIGKAPEALARASTSDSNDKSMQRPRTFTGVREREFKRFGPHLFVDVQNGRVVTLSTIMPRKRASSIPPSPDSLQIDTSTSRRLPPASRAQFQAPRAIEKDAIPIPKDPTDRGCAKALKSAGMPVKVAFALSSLYQSDWRNRSEWSCILPRSLRICHLVMCNQESRSCNKKSLHSSVVMMWRLVVVQLWRLMMVMVVVVMNQFFH